MDGRSTDERSAIYQDLHARQLEFEEANNRHSAHVILSMLLKMFKPKSMLDVGCGLGTWLSVAREMGVREVNGIDGVWLDKTRLRVPADLVQVLDLEKPFDLGRRFDLVTCLEVAEHLDGSIARNFIASITAHTDVLLFSAAIPFQGGHHHVNEQWPDYWQALFQEKGYQPVDFIRERIWKDNSILWWLRQNILLFVNDRSVQDNNSFRELSRSTSPLSMVHPEVYMLKMKAAQTVIDEHNKLIGLLSSGGTFNVQKEPNGQITIKRSS
jgi:SAM-dependent methyltransferase